MSKKEDIEKMENLNNEEVKRESAEKDIKNEKVQNLLKEAKEKGSITYEDLAKQLDGVNPDQIDSVFDAFQEIGVDLLDDVSDENIDFAMEVKGVLNGEVGQSLGYVFVKNNVMIATDTFGLYVGYKAFSTLTEEDKDFYDSIKAGMSKAEISELTGSETAKNNVLDIYAEVFNFAKLTEYDSYIETSFNEFSTGDSVLLNIKNNYEVLTAVEVKDDSAKTLGYAYAIYLENAYGNNTMLIALNADGTFKQALDINNNHSNIDKWQETNPNVFTSGMTLEQINNIKYDVVADALFTIESIKLGILIAMNEQGQTNNSNYEAAAKKVFSGMVTGRSTILNSFSNQSILYGYDVIGAASSTSGNPTEHLGYAYVVKGTLADVDGRPASASLTLMVGVNLDGTLAGVVIVENGQTAGRASTIADYITRFTSGMSASDVNAVEYVSGATYGCNLVKHLINIALEEGGNN